MERWEGPEHAAAADIAGEAGRMLVALRSDFDGGIGSLRDAGDRSAHRLIVGRLAERFPDDPVLSEEGRDDHRRLESSRVWIVDPLDGTREYGEGRDDWAVHVAMVVDGVPRAAAVALPVRSLVLGTSPPPPLPAAHDGPLRMVVSRSRPPELARAVAHRLGAELVGMGSAGAKTMAVVLGDVDVYLHSGGQYEWDSCAPVAVAAACGLHVSRLDGSELLYNRANPWLPDQLVCRPELATTVLEAVQELG